jgi:hypothetical protein
MESRPMPGFAVMTICALLLGTACLMASRSLALAADGAFQLVRVLGTGDVYGFDARILGAATHQAAVIVAARAGLEDTQLLALLLGVGQLVVPAVVWSLAVALSREDRLVCAAVAMIAGLNAGATWFFNVVELVLAVPLTTLVAVLLWRPRTWRWREVAIATPACVVLVASYETALLTGAVLAAWAVWRGARSTARAERVGCALVAGLAVLSVLVASAGTASGPNSTHSQSFLYFVVSLEPWPFYLALAGIAALLLAVGPWLQGAAANVSLALGSGALIVAALGLEPGPVTAFQARGGAAVSGFLLELFLLWRWIDTRSTAAEEIPLARQRVLVAAPIVFVAAMVAVNIGPVGSWSRSLDTFRTHVNGDVGVIDVEEAVPPNRREVVWGWTSSSLSLLVRTDTTSAILFDRRPSLLPFQPQCPLPASGRVHLGGMSAAAFLGFRKILATATEALRDERRLARNRPAVGDAFLISHTKPRKHDSDPVVAAAAHAGVRRVAELPSVLGAREVGGDVVGS